MLKIEKVILHLLDPSTNVITCSETCMKQKEEGLAFIESKIKKVLESEKRRKASFVSDSYMFELFQKYQDHTITFEDMTQQMASYIFTCKMRCGLFDASDLFFCEVVYEQRRYLIALDHSYGEAMMHELVQQNEKICYEVMKCHTLLSSSLVKKDCAFLIEVGDQSLSILEPQVEVEGKKQYFYGDIVLGCVSQPSYQEAMKQVQSACKEVIKECSLDAVKVLPKMKQLIVESVEAQEDIEIEEMAQIVFATQPKAQQQFKEKMQEKGVQPSVSVENVTCKKAEKVQKIKTDKGIELIIPIDYMDARDVVEFCTQEDGSIVIQLKNIQRIISK